MPLTYDDIPRTADERTTLLQFLRWQRDTLERKCNGLTDEQLRERAAPPSTLTLMGLVRHMTEVERGWFIRTLGQRETGHLYVSDDNEDGDFDDVEGAEGADALRAWREECSDADTVIEQHGLDDVVQQRNGRAVSLRWLLVHMVEEYSRHNGHADLLRERTDGATGY